MLFLPNAFDRVMKRLYLGSVPDYSLQLPFTHVLDLRDSGIENAPRNFAYLHLSSADDGSPRTWEWIRDGVLFAHEAMVSNGSLLVHCSAGVHRSPSMVYAILRAYNFSAESAEKLITESRPCARVRYKPSIDRVAKMLPAFVNSKWNVERAERVEWENGVR